MFVVATAGHVDHGKSTVVRRLTGMEPDRWAEERRRGLTIDLGFAWLELPGGARLAFVDVPGHERFVPNMLAGIGPVPAAIMVVAADEGWMPQSAEHLAALHALRIEHALLVVTKSDLADPEPARRQALARIADSCLGAVPSVAVSAVTGAGMDKLTAALGRLTAALPPPDPLADVRLWVDRAFTVRGAGTVVTGTLSAGTIRVGDELLLCPGERAVRVRGLQTLSAGLSAVSAVSRIAVNLRGVERAEIRRGAALLSPNRWETTTTVDVEVDGDPVGQLQGELIVHSGSSAVPARVRPLGRDCTRLRLGAPLPLRYGDRLLLRDPGRHRIVAGASVLDSHPPELTRRGAARTRSVELARIAEGGSAAARAAQLSRYGFLTRARLRVLGLPAGGSPIVGDWHADPEHAAELAARIGPALDEWQRANPLAAGMPAESAIRLLELPSHELLPPLLERAGLRQANGLISRGTSTSTLPAGVEKALAQLESELRVCPFAAPDANRLAALGLGSRELAAAVRIGRLLKLADGIVLLPDAPEQAADALARLPQPFTVSAAKRELGTTRRVAVPLLELLDRLRRTDRHPDSTRHVLPEPNADG